MKVFRLAKRAEDKAEEMQDLTNAKISSLEIKRTLEFQEIHIKNPYNSSHIYIINSLRLGLKQRKNKLKLLMGERPEREDGQIKLGFLEISCQAQKESKDTYIELVSGNFSQDKPHDLLDEHFVILLPGGELLIGLEKGEKAAEVDIEWLEEKI